MRGKSILVLLIVGLLFASVGGVMAQVGAQVPAIVSFTADETDVLFSAVEAGTATVNLSWHIVNVQAGQRVALDYAVQNGWVSVLSQGEALQPVGTREVTLRDPLNFGPPTFRLTLLSGRNIVDQRFITLGYATNMALPSIEAFTSDAESFSRGALGSRTARVTVSWRINNRQPGTNLVFEQVVAPDQLATIELPRQFLYVPSAGSGPVQTVPTNSDALRLRLSIVDVISGAVQATQDLVIPFTGEAAPADLPTPAAAPTSISLPQGEPASPDASGQAAEATLEPGASTETGAVTINAFTINPTTAPAGSSVTIAWNVTGATNVQIQEIIAGATQPGVTYVQLPLLGAVSVPLPADATTAVTYRLSASADDGSIAQSEIIVTVGDSAG